MSPQEEDKKEQKQKVIPPCRVSGIDLEIIKEKAAAAGVTLSEYVRRCCLDGYIVERRPIVDIKLIKELKRQGSNFNNYQHKLNALGKDSPAEVKRVTLKIKNLLDTLQGF